MTWEELDWAALDRLRDQFLSGAPAAGYWTSRDDLANYDFTFARRIGWKWDAVLRELDLRGWKPPGPAAVNLEHGSAPPAGTAGASRRCPTVAKVDQSSATDGSGAPRWTVLDWGCGSGVAGRRVVNWLGADRVAVLRVWDQSPLAGDFAAEAARAEFPTVAVEQVTPGFLAADTPVGVLVISHVLNELPAEELAALRGLAGRAAAILWVEPGTYEVSRGLLEVREWLRDRFSPVAPCTHRAACGLRTPENARHWCHHFAPAPAGVHTDSNWVRFARRAGIDLRSLPYSFLVLEHGSALREPAAPLARVIGEPRLYKGFARVLSCEADGVTELTIQKRDAPQLFRQFKRPVGPLVCRWDRDQGTVVGGRVLDSPGAV